MPLWPIDSVCIVSRQEFLDLCMKITDPEHYHSIAKSLQETKRSRETYVDEFIKPLSVRLDDLGVPYRIIGRPKSIYSIWNKIRNKRVPFEEIYDLFAVRIILDVPPFAGKIDVLASL